MVRKTVVRAGRRIPVVWVLLLSCVLWTLPAAWASEEEPGGGEEYVRTVNDTGSLADREKGEGWSYNGEYIYALTREVRDSSLPSAAKVVVFVPAAIVDTAFLPVAAIFGLFGG
jgi:hypothetical protein